MAEFFLTQTPADNVAAVFPTFIDRFPDLTAVRTTDVETLQQHIEPLGFQKKRANALHAIAREYDHLPEDPNTLRELPQVGPYIANATVCFALNERIPIIDRNVRRVYDRVFGPSFPNGHAEQKDFAESLLPQTGVEARKYNLYLLDFGALQCTKLSPKCEYCFAQENCEYYQRST